MYTLAESKLHAPSPRVSTYNCMTWKLVIRSFFQNSGIFLPQDFMAGTVNKQLKNFRKLCSDMHFWPVYYKNMNSFIDFSQKSNHLFFNKVFQGVCCHFYIIAKNTLTFFNWLFGSGNYKQTLRWLDFDWMNFEPERTLVSVKQFPRKHTFFI